MNRTIPLLIVALLAIGCQSTPDGKSSIAPAVKMAAFVGTTYALQQRPEWRLEFESAHRELAVIEAAETIDFVTVLAIVQRLPVKELKSDNATLVITAGTILLTEYGGSLDLNQSAETRAVVRALREGIALGLGDQPSAVIKETQAIQKRSL